MNKSVMKKKSTSRLQGAYEEANGQKSFSIPNSAILYRMGAKPPTGNENQENIKSLLMSRLPMHALRNQIPAAEQEADRISSSLSGARAPGEVKSLLGARMGADFSNVRFHSDSMAAAQADAIGARAFTTGRDIYFGEGGFDSSVAAHELVHTVQQGAVDSSLQTVSAPMGGVQMVPKWLKGIGKGLGTLVGGALGLAGGLVGGLVGGIGGLFAGSPLKGAKAGLKMGAAPGAYIMEKLGFKHLPGFEKGNERRANRGDMSGFAGVSKKYAKEKTDEQAFALNAELELNPELTSEDIAQHYGGTATQALNPLNRKALSKVHRDAAARAKETGSEADKAKAKKYDEAMELIDQRMMVDTITGPSEADTAKLTEHYKNKGDLKRLDKEYSRSPIGKRILGPDGLSGPGTISGTRTDEEAQALADKDVATAKESGDSMLRMMLLMQLGDFQQNDVEVTTDDKGKKTKTPISKEWQHSMANALSHGARTAFTFGADEMNGDDVAQNGKSSDVMRAIFNTQNDQELGENAGLAARASATHRLITPKAGQGPEGLEEQSGLEGAVKSMFDSSYHHYGMDMAIGGAGKEGGAGENGPEIITNDGRSGHLYVGAADSSQERKGGMLVGLESDSPYRMNQTGHMHNAAADPEEASSTGGLKTDAKGKKYGGRTVDLSGLKNTETTQLLQTFTGRLAGKKEDPQAYKTFVNKIAGKRLPANELVGVLMDLGMEKEQARAYVAKGRKLKADTVWED